MTHRAESILAGVQTNLTGLATTGANIKRGRVWPTDVRPALSIFKGEDRASDELIDPLERELEIEVHIHTKQTGNPETYLNAIAAEVFAAMTADITQGLAYVFNTELAADSAPEIDDAQDLPVARMVSTWLITYEHSPMSTEL